MLTFYTMGIAKALNTVLERINNSAVRAGRDRGKIKLIAVTKTVNPESIIEAINSGVSIVGENRVQEARDKIANLKSQIPNLNVEWHLIGTLQKNKAKTAVRFFDLIHSVDSKALAEELNKHSKTTDKKQRVLVQVKLSDEGSKHGISEENLMELLEQISGMENLELEGIMTIPPFFENPEGTRPYFKRLRALADRAIEKGFQVNELSMGMSNDFEVAIEEGATMVRIGTAIFGERNL